MWSSGQISAGSALAVPYKFPQALVVTVRVTCDQPVTTLFVDLDGKATWEAGGTPGSMGGFARRRDHVFTTRLPPRNFWFLLIENPNPAPVTVQYEVVAEPGGPPTGFTGPTGATGGWLGSGSI